MHRANDAGHCDLVAAKLANARIVTINACECGRKAVGVTFPAHFTIGDHVDAGPFLIPNRDQSGVVLSLFQERFRDAPDVVRAHAWYDFSFSTSCATSQAGCG